MAFMIDFEAGPQRAFMRGFFRGLAAPVALFSRNEAPLIPIVPSVQPVLTGSDAASALAADWVRVVDSMRLAVEHHEQGQQAPSAPHRAGGR